MRPTILEVTSDNENISLPPPPSLPRVCGYEGLSAEEPTSKKTPGEKLPKFRDGWGVDPRGNYYKQDNPFREIEPTPK